MNIYSDEVKKLFKLSEQECLKLNHPYVSIEHFILSVLNTNNFIKDLLNKQQINYKNYRNELIKYSNKIKQNDNDIIFYTPIFKKIIDDAVIYTIENNEKEISLSNIFISIIDSNNGTGVQILKNLNCNLENLYKEIIKYNFGTKNLLINELGVNLNEQATLGNTDKLIGREKEIERVFEILARKNKNNPILIGEAGVGKTAIVEEIANRINNKKVPNFLLNKTIISLSMSTLISGTKYRGEFEEKLGKILNELSQSNDLILFIDEVHTLVGAGGAEGAIDASNILKPALARKNIKCIGATTINEYRKFIEKDKALDRRFQKVFIEAPSLNETKNIIKKIKKDYEKFHNVKIPDDIINQIVELSNKYIFDRNEPDKSIDVLDEICAKTSIISFNKDLTKLKKELNKIRKDKINAIKSNDFKSAGLFKSKENKIYNKINILKNKNIKEVTKETLKEVLESKSNSTIFELETKNQFYTLNKQLNKEIIGQNEPIKKLLNIILNKNLSKPTSILLNGPTGVGKTQTIINLSKLLNKNLIRLDMSEYNNEISINRILGSPQGYIGYDDGNTTFESIKTKPDSIILLDEIDKAHVSIINLFFSILDNGIIKNSKGEELNFKNAIIIMTTNNYTKENIVGFEHKNNINFDLLSKEFINRINYTIEYNKLKKEDIKKIIKSQSNELSNEEILNIIKESNYELFGARQIKNIIKKYLEKNTVYI